MGLNTGAGAQFGLYLLVYPACMVLLSSHPCDNVLSNVGLHYMPKTMKYTEMFEKRRGG